MDLLRLSLDRMSDFYKLKDYELKQITTCVDDDLELQEIQFLLAERGYDEYTPTLDNISSEYYDELECMKQEFSSIVQINASIESGVGLTGITYKTQGGESASFE